MCLSPASASAAAARGRRSGARSKLTSTGTWSKSSKLKKAPHMAPLCSQALALAIGPPLRLLVPRPFVSPPASILSLPPSPLSTPAIPLSAASIPQQEKFLIHTESSDRLYRNARAFHPTP